MRILLTGKNGQLGRCFQDVVGDNKGIELIAFDSFELDITNSQKVDVLFDDLEPDLIVNAAAYTAVDKAESESLQAYAVNKLGVENLARQARKLDIPLIHISTDYVFDGKAVEPYQICDLTNPLGVYGASKLAGEFFIKDTCKKYIILRTSWVFSEYGNNFVKTMVKLATDRESIGIVGDQYGCPTYAGDIARVIKEICEKYHENREIKWGVYHYCGDSPTSWHGFARAIIYYANKKGLFKTLPHLFVMSTDQYPTQAKRPEYSVLDTSELSALNLKPSSWLKGLKAVINKLAGS